MKKFFPILVVLIICVVFGSFVACNKKDESKDILRSDMTLDEVKEALKDVKSYRRQSRTSDADGAVLEDYVFGTNGYSLVVERISFYDVTFFEDNKYYYMYGNSDVEEIMIVDCSGYDVNYDFDREGVDVLVSLMTEYGYTIKDNTIYIEDVNTHSTHVFYEFNVAKTEPYGKYKSTYKTLQPTTSLLVYGDLDDNSCELAEVNAPLKTLQIPEAYNGKSVTKVVCENVKNLIIPKTVKELRLRSISDDMIITYLGTKEEFYANVRTNTSIAACDIECSDGTIKKGDSLTVSNGN